MKQSSNIDEVETWLEGIMTYKSVANITKSHSHHTNENHKRFTLKSYQGSQITKQNGVVKCAQVCGFLNMKLCVIEMWGQKQIIQIQYELKIQQCLERPSTINHTSVSATTKHKQT